MHVAELDQMRARLHQSPTQVTELLRCSQFQPQHHVSLFDMARQFPGLLRTQPDAQCLCEVDCAPVNLEAGSSAMGSEVQATAPALA
jgi:hypothetical protein